MRRRLVSIALACGIMGIAATAKDKPDEAWSVSGLKAAMAKLVPLNQKLGAPKPGEWLDRFKEKGQTFDEYLKCRPNVPTDERRTLYVQPLGTFTEKQRKIITLSSEYMGIYFSMPVNVLPDLPLSVVPEEARRVHPTLGDKQIHAGWVLDKLLKPKVPKDAFALIAFTSSDLWPGAGWNFVFGQASLRDRVGVWSFARFGDTETDDGLRACLRRTLATGTHETGHMFTIEHCTAYECNMCGSNSLTEADKRPLSDCPECMAKVCWATHDAPGPRYAKLAEFCEKHGLKSDAERFGAFAASLK